MDRAKWCLTGLIAVVVAGAALAGVTAKMGGIQVSGSKIVASADNGSFKVEKGHLVSKNSVLNITADSMLFRRTDDNAKKPFKSTDLSGNVNVSMLAKDGSKEKATASEGRIDWKKHILTLNDAVLTSDTGKVTAAVLKIEFSDAGVGSVEVKDVPGAG